MNHKIYERKILRYKPTIDAIMEDFQDNIFGTYSNKRSKESFVEALAFHGWKYFDLKNLNELFSMMLAKYGTEEVESDDEVDPLLEKMPLKLGDGPSLVKLQAPTKVLSFPL